jgi:hypothetical protein
MSLVTEVLTAGTVYLNILFPNGNRYYFELIENDSVPILIDHPFRLYFPRTTDVEWNPPNGTNGVFLTIEAVPSFPPFPPEIIQIPVSQGMYDTIIGAINSGISNPVETTNEVNFIASNMLALTQFLLEVSPTIPVLNLTPPVEAKTSGLVEFVLMSTEEGEQIKLDFSHTFPYPPEAPIVVKTLTWNQVLYWVMQVQNPEFVYIPSGAMGMTFIDPRFCFLREWITLPVAWVAALKNFAGIK